MVLLAAVNIYFPVGILVIKPMSTNSLRQFLKTRGWSAIYSPHATRTTGSTRLNELGYRPDAIEAQLAHMDSNSVRHSYNHATYLEERKIMMQDWADKLDIWVKRANFELKP
ncbi:Prophage CP4-57 integrase [Providencia stuartii]|nr:Prophage CP4-57 integrase [Providencia stuartii]CAK6614533.1 Prophage CP4-57 integrase [Providencia stuartii]